MAILSHTGQWHSTMRQTDKRIYTPTVASMASNIPRKSYSQSCLVLGLAVDYISTSLMQKLGVGPCVPIKLPSIGSSQTETV